MSLDRLYNTISSGDNKTALKISASLIQRNSNKTLVKALRALVLARLRRKKESLLLCDELRLGGISTTNVAVPLILAYEALGAWDEALDVAEKSAVLDPTSEETVSKAFANSVKAMNFNKQQQIAMKLKAKFQRPRHLEWVLVSLLLQTRGGALQAGKGDMAELLLKKLPLPTQKVPRGTPAGREEHKEAKTVILLHISFLYGQHQYDQAIEVLSRSLAVVEWIPSEYTALHAQLRLARGDYEHVTSTMQEIIYSDPDCEWSHFVVAIEASVAQSFPPLCGNVDLKAAKPIFELLHRFEEAALDQEASPVLRKMCSLAVLEVIRRVPLELHRRKIRASRPLGDAHYSEGLPFIDGIQFWGTDLLHSNGGELYARCKVETYVTKLFDFISQHASSADLFTNIRSHISTLSPDQRQQLRERLDSLESLLYATALAHATGAAIAKWCGVLRCLYAVGCFGEVPQACDITAAIEKWSALHRLCLRSDTQYRSFKHQLSGDMLILLLADCCLRLDQLIFQQKQTESREGRNGRWFFDALIILEVGVKLSPQNYFLKFALLVLYGCIGAVTGFSKYFTDLQIKNAQILSLGAALGRRLSLFGATDGLKELMVRINGAHDSLQDAAVEGLVSCYEHGAYEKIPEVMALVQALRDSADTVAAKIELQYISLAGCRTAACANEVLIFESTVNLFELEQAGIPRVLAVRDLVGRSPITGDAPTKDLTINGLSNGAMNGHFRRPWVRRHMNYMLRDTQPLLSQLAAVSAVWAATEFARHPSFLAIHRPSFPLEPSDKGTPICDCGKSNYALPAYIRQSSLMLPSMTCVPPASLLLPEGMLFDMGLDSICHQTLLLSGTSHTGVETCSSQDDNITTSGLCTVQLKHASEELQIILTAEQTVLYLLSSLARSDNGEIPVGISMLSTQLRDIGVFAKTGHEENVSLGPSADSNFFPWESPVINSNTRQAWGIVVMVFETTARILRIPDLADNEYVLSELRNVERAIIVLNEMMMHFFTVLIGYIRDETTGNETPSSPGDASRRLEFSRTTIDGLTGVALLIRLPLLVLIVCTGTMAQVLTSESKRRGSVKTQLLQIQKLLKELITESNNQSKDLMNALGGWRTYFRQSDAAPWCQPYIDDPENQVCYGDIGLPIGDADRSAVWNHMKASYGSICFQLKQDIQNKVLALKEASSFLE